MARRRYYSSKKVGAGYYAGVDSRRRQEREDGGMISEDRNAIANLPQGVIMREYPKDGYAQYPHLDDTYKGIDHQINRDSGKKKTYPEKY